MTWSYELVGDVLPDFRSLDVEHQEDVLDELEATCERFADQPPGGDRHYVLVVHEREDGWDAVNLRLALDHRGRHAAAIGLLTASSD